jgi:hypothetical protein
MLLSFLLNQFAVSSSPLAFERVNSSSKLFWSQRHAYHYLQPEVSKLGVIKSREALDALRQFPAMSSPRSVEGMVMKM